MLATSKNVRSVVFFSVSNLLRPINPRVPGYLILRQICHAHPKKDLPLSFPKDTVLVPRPPLKSSPALDMGAKNIGNYNRAIYVSDLSDKYIIGKVDKPKGAYFETVNAYLLKKDWIKK